MLCNQGCGIFKQRTEEAYLPLNYCAGIRPWESSNKELKALEETRRDLGGSEQNPESSNKELKYLKFVEEAKKYRAKVESSNKELKNAILNPASNIASVHLGNLQTKN